MKYQSLVVKVGTNVLTTEDGMLDVEQMEALVSQVGILRKRGVKVIWVTSGAVAAGRSILPPFAGEDAVTHRQVLAAVGQVKLLQAYSIAFEKHGLFCAQVLATKEDFRTRRHYLNMKNCFSALRKRNVVPVVNENDVVSITELMFTDNDELAGMIASMMQADALVLLTSVDGLYDRNPRDPEANLISCWNEHFSGSKVQIDSGKSLFGRGGMRTKLTIAQRLARLGISVHIANGKKPEVLLRILDREKEGTFFEAHRKKSELKRWIANSQGFAKGFVVVDEGAKSALFDLGQARSLLPIGVVRVDGEFQKGDVVLIRDEKGNVVGYGLAQYSAERAKSLVGKAGQRPLIHYDHIHVSHEGDSDGND